MKNSANHSNSPWPSPHLSTSLPFLQTSLCHSGLQGTSSLHSTNVSFQGPCHPWECKGHSKQCILPPRVQGRLPHFTSELLWSVSDQVLSAWHHWGYPCLFSTDGEILFREQSHDSQGEEDRKGAGQEEEKRSMYSYWFHLDIYYIFEPSVSGNQVSCYVSTIFVCASDVNGQCHSAWNALTALSIPWPVPFVLLCLTL